MKLFLIAIGIIVLLYIYYIYNNREHFKNHSWVKFGNEYQKCKGNNVDELDVTDLNECKDKADSLNAKYLSFTSSQNKCRIEGNECLSPGRTGGWNWQIYKTEQMQQQVPQQQVAPQQQVTPQQQVPEQQYSCNPSDELKSLIGTEATGPTRDGGFSLVDSDVVNYFCESNAKDKNTCNNSMFFFSGNVPGKSNIITNACKWQDLPTQQISQQVPQVPQQVSPEIDWNNRLKSETLCCTKDRSCAYFDTDLARRNAKSNAERDLQEESLDKAT